MRLKVRSLVGLLPLCASTVSRRIAERFPRLTEMIELFRKRHPELVSQVAPTETGFVGHKGRRLLSLLSKKKLERVLAYMLDEDEFLGPHGIRSLSRYHQEHPFTFWVGSEEFKVQYLPAESNNGMFGGNSNWRGPVWMPVNALIVRALLNLYAFYGDEFTVECPTGSGRRMNLFEVAEEIARRLSGTFLRDADGHRPCTEEPRSSRTIRTGAISCCSTSTSTATTAPGWAPVTRPGGPVSSPCSSICSAGWMRRPCSKASGRPCTPAS